MDALVAIQWAFELTYDTDIVDADVLAGLDGAAMPDEGDAKDENLEDEYARYVEFLTDPDKFISKNSADQRVGLWTQLRDAAAKVPISVAPSPAPTGSSTVTPSPTKSSVPVAGSKVAAVSKPAGLSTSAAMGMVGTPSPGAGVGVAMMAGAPPTPAGRHGSTGRASGAGGRGAERDDGKAAEVARVKEEQAKQTWALRHTPPPYHAWCHANISAEAKQWRLAIEAQFKILRQTSKTPAEHESARKEIARIKEIALKYKQGAFGMTLYFKRFGGFIIALIGALQKGTLLGDSQYRAHYVTGKIPAMLKA